jgi:capsular exopolysaccharide synthesis family protein
MTNALDPDNASARDSALELVTLHRALRRLDGLAPEPNLELETYDEGGFDVRRYWGIILRRKWIVFALVVASFVSALVVTYNTAPVYRSSLLLQIEPRTDQFLDFQGSVSTGDQAMDWKFYQTQYDLLKSRSLARRVIDQLGLEAAAQKRSPTESEPSYLAELKGSIRGLLTNTDTASDRSDPPAAEAKRNKPNLEGALLGNLTVSPLPDSRLVRISYDSTKPQEAAAVVNAIAENYINMTLERRYDATAYAKKFLEERIKQVRANLEDSERRLTAYAREREIVDIDDKLGNLLQTLNAMNEKLVGVEAQRIEAESQYSRSLEGKGLAAHKVLESGTIQMLKAQKGELEVEYQEQLKVYKPGYPKMQQLRRQIGEIDQQINEEIASIGDAVKTGYEAKVQEQAALQARVSEVKTELLELQNRSTDFQALKREVNTNRELYDGLLQRMKEVGVVAGITTNNISIVDRALVPGSAYKPDLRKNLAVAVALGLIAGILLAVLLEHMDDSVKTSEDIENHARIPVLGVVPMVPPKDRSIAREEIPLIAAKDPRSPVAEAVRSLRTSLIFSTAESAPKIMHVTSPGPGEGKTTIATNVAITFALAGGKVLLVDADLRAPSIHGVFSLPNTLGLTNYLVGDAEPASVAQPTLVQRLYAVTSGPLPPNPVELLSSAKMLDLLGLASERFDYVVLDGPPLLGLADALVLSKVSDGTIFVVDAGRTRHGELEGAVKRLRAAKTRILGGVLDRYGRQGQGYGYGYGYNYDYHYTYGDRDQGRALPEKA